MSKFIKPCEGRVTSHFSPLRKNPVTGINKAHKGIDYGKDGSNVINAAADGTVIRATFIGGYGNTVILRHLINGQRYETLYAHLHSISVKVGQYVKQGQKIGIKGTTGNSTGVHLHFEIHKPNYAPGQPNAIDPYPLVYDPEIEEIQKQLKHHGFKLTPDGIFGDITDKAIKTFQAQNGLKADGIIGKDTIAKLMKPKKAIAGVDNSSKLMWGKTELKNGQIGKITVLKTTKLLKESPHSSNELVEVRELKSGEEYRVYSYREDHGGQYNVGGGMWVNKMPEHIKYETPSKAMLERLNS